MLAVQHKNISSIKKLIDCDADINLETPKGTVLTLACASGSESVVMQLLRLDASVNYQTRTGCTALLAACMTQQVKVVNCLLSFGADKEMVSSNGSSALTLVQTLAPSKSRETLLRILNSE